MAERNLHAGQPITDDDAAIAAALEDVSIPTLVLGYAGKRVAVWRWTREPDLRAFVIS